MEDFVHLHVHSDYSLLDSLIRIQDTDKQIGLITAARKLGMNSIALTDHGSLAGAIEFYNAAKAGGVKPILGMEADIENGAGHDTGHLLLLAMNTEGWQNLIKLTSLSASNDVCGRSCLTLDMLAEHNNGLICTTGCNLGHVPSALIFGSKAEAKRIATQYLNIFGPERFFIEIQANKRPGQKKSDPIGDGLKKNNLMLISLARKLGIGLVATNNVHTLARRDKDSRDVVVTISLRKKTGYAPDYYLAEQYLKSPAQMHMACRDLPADALVNTIKIAEMCNVELDLNVNHFPAFHLPAVITADQQIRRTAFEGLKSRIGENPSPEYTDRLEMELKVVASKGWSSYFLILHDFVKFAGENNIPCGARGSGASTLLGYCLGISQCDPVRYGLLFERWLCSQSDRSPDIDIDICRNGRSRVIEYIRMKYGHIAQIITYGTFGVRVAVEDVGRAMEISPSRLSEITARIPIGPNVTLDSTINADAELQKLARSKGRIRELFNHVRAVEGLKRHSGVNAAGIIVADQPLDNFVPLCRQANSQYPVTQWDGPTCQKLGLMKIDLPSLPTLTIIQKARDLVQSGGWPSLNPDTLPLDDDMVYELFRTANTDNVFQFESQGMKNILIQMQPTRIEDLIAANAMYRPGAMELIVSYCNRMHGKEGIPVIHPTVDALLAETYGILCYQEQAMSILNRVGSLDWDEAWALIKAINKGDASAIESRRLKFMEGAKTNGVAIAQAEGIFDFILKFAGQTFAKAHSTRYAMLAYQTAYFKVHHPKEFSAATTVVESGWVYTPRPQSRHDGHFLSRFNRPGVISLSDLKHNLQIKSVIIGCVIAKSRQVVVKKGVFQDRKMMRLTIEDMSGMCNATILCDDYERLVTQIMTGVPVLISAEVDHSHEKPSLTIQDVAVMKLPDESSAIPLSLIGQVVQATDIVNLIGSYLTLKQKGREYIGLCPFHDDHKPSMYVNREKQIFKCFSCGAGGDLFQFVMVKEKVDFHQAVRILAERAGIPMPPENTKS